MQGWERSDVAEDARLGRMQGWKDTGGLGSMQGWVGCSAGKDAGLGRMPCWEGCRAGKGEGL